MFFPFAELLISSLHRIQIKGYIGIQPKRGIQTTLLNQLFLSALACGALACGVLACGALACGALAAALGPLACFT